MKSKSVVSEVDREPPLGRFLTPMAEPWTGFAARYGGSERLKRE